MSDAPDDHEEPLTAAAAIGNGIKAIKVRPDGALARVKLELYALLLADLLSANDAWHLSGHAPTGTYRRIVEANRTFKGRLQVLMDERAACEADPIFGESKWQAGQLWRIARATNEIGMLKDAAALRWKITERELAYREAEATRDGAGKRAPGRPAADPPANAGAGNAADMRAALATVGIPVGEPN